MKLKAHDASTGHLFSWDGDFRYEGVVSDPPDECVSLPEDMRIAACLSGGCFLSGWARTVIFGIFSDGDSISPSLCFLEGGVDKEASCRFAWTPARGVDAPADMPVVICGQACADPEKVAELCAKYPGRPIYACSLTDELAAFGALVVAVDDKDNPRRAPLCVPRLDDIPGTEGVEFDPKLEGDAEGLMARLVAGGMPVLNEMMSPVGISPYHGRVLTMDGHPEDPCFIVRSSSVDRLFPSEPVSLKHFAATSVFASVTVTPQFSEVSGVDEGTRVSIFVATDYVPGVSDMMRFYQLVAGRDFIGTSRPEMVSSVKNMPVFRYNKAYSVPMEERRESR